MKREAAVLLLLLPVWGCEDEVEWSGPPPSEFERLRAQKRDEPRATSPDRLPPGELLEGPDEVFGIAVPRGMVGHKKGPKIAEITGSADYDLLVDYIKARISVRHAEMLEDRLVFPNARILGSKDRIYELTVRRLPRGSKVTILDVTKLPGTGGLSEEERWKRAGLKPGGGLIDPNAME